jgi:hypothetical protein
MFNKSFLISAAILVMAVAGRAEQGIVIKSMAVCTGIEDRQPVGADTLFFNTVERLYCFTHVTGAEDTVTVTHVWYMGDKEMARVDLAVKSPSWRTWSSKRILPGWTGAWRVDVLSEDGKLLESRAFKILFSSH